MIQVPPEQLYMDRPRRPNKVMLKIVKVILHNGKQSMETHAILDDGSERSIVLQPAVESLKLESVPETLPLQTVRQDVLQVQGASVSLEISQISKPSQRYWVHHAFTANQLGLSEHSYPVESLQKRYRHLHDLPLLPVHRAQPQILIGSDIAHLLVPLQPVSSGPQGGPIAVWTRLGWALQGPISLMKSPGHEQQYLFTKVVTQEAELRHHVEKLWQIDVLFYLNEKLVTRSKQDQEALELLASATTKIKVKRVSPPPSPTLPPGSAGSKGGSSAQPLKL